MDRVDIESTETAEDTERLDKQERDAFVTRNGYISIGDFEAERRSLSVKLGKLNDETIYARLIYDPNAITDDMRAEFIGEQVDDDAGGDAALAVSRALSAVVVEWNFSGPLHKTVRTRTIIEPENEDGEETVQYTEKRVMIVGPGEYVNPKDAELVRHMRSDFNQKMMRAIFNDVEGAVPERQRPSRKRS